jgi:colanic acid biosynthesis glycosyl transferase WcaI
MRLLIVSQYFRPENFRINDLAQGLIKLGHQVMVLTGKSDYSSGQFFDGYSFWGISREMFAGIEVIRVPLVLRGHGGATRLVLNFLSFALFTSLFDPLWCRGSFDVVFGYGPSPVMMG